MALQKYQIQDGPGRYDLERALFDGKPISFTYNNSECDDIVVDSMGCLADHDRDGWWLMKGHRPTFPERGHHQANPFTFTVMYHVGKRKGEIEIDMSVEE